MSIRFAFALLLLSAVVGCNNSESDKGTAGTSPAASPQVADSVALLGSWDVVAVEEDGTVKSPEKVKGSLFTFTADTMSVLQAGRPKPDEMKYRLDEAKKFIDAEDVGHSRKSVGIYELKGDDLRICINDKPNSTERPTGFKTEPKSPNGIVFTLKRAPK